MLFADTILTEVAPVFAVFEDWVAMLPTPKDLEYGVGAGSGKPVKIEKPRAPYFIDAHPCNPSKGAAASHVIVSAKTGAVAAQGWAAPSLSYYGAGKDGPAPEIEDRFMIVTKPTMSEDAARFYAALFSALTIIGLIAGGAYSILQYFETRSRENKTYELQVATAQLEAKKPFYTKHLDLCSEASSAAATLATSKDSQKRQEATDNFWRLWDGPLAMVEGESVAGAMIDFGSCLKAKCGNLPALSIEISHSCRQEISDHFELRLSDLPKPDQRR